MPAFKAMNLRWGCLGQVTFMIIDHNVIQGRQNVWVCRGRNKSELRRNKSGILCFWLLLILTPKQMRPRRRPERSEGRRRGGICLAEIPPSDSMRR